MDYLNEVFSSFSGRFGEILPGIFGALVVLFIGIILANVAKRVVLALFRKTNLDERLGAKMNSNVRLDHFIAKLVYFLVMMYVLLLVLNMMGVGGVLEPLSNMLDKFLAFLPNIVAAGIIGYVGYVVATLAAEAVGFLATSLQRISEKAGLSGSLSLPNIVKQLAFVLVFIPILIAALDALKMEAISAPATQMFNKFLNAIPNIIAAVALLFVFYIAGKYVVSLLTDLLRNLGLDRISQSLGLSKIIGPEVSLSKLIGNTAFFFLMFSGLIAAMDKLELGAFTGILKNIFALAGQVFFGLVILVLGNYVATVAKRAIDASGQDAWLGNVVRYAVLFIFLAMGLSTMGIGEDIVNLAFGLTIGAVAVAFALSFGLGGREAAGKTMGRFLERFNKN